MTMKSRGRPTVIHYMSAFQNLVVILMHYSPSYAFVVGVQLRIGSGLWTEVSNLSNLDTIGMKETTLISEVS